MKVIHSGHIEHAQINSQTIEAIIGLYYSKYESELRPLFSFLGDDIDTFEGGISSWFGYGSVMVDEFNLSFNIKLTNQGVDIELVDWCDPADDLQHQGEL